MFAILNNCKGPKVKKTAKCKDLYNKNSMNNLKKNTAANGDWQCATSGWRFKHGQKDMVIFGGGQCQHWRLVIHAPEGISDWEIYNVMNLVDPTKTTCLSMTKKNWSV